MEVKPAGFSLLHLLAIETKKKEFEP